MQPQVRTAYSHRAAEYTEHLGTTASVHPSDLQLVTAWADQLDGPLVDAGCGPGHWTGYLADRGLTVRGVDMVPEFIRHARATHPRGTFEVESINTLSDTSGSVAGVLSWYSLIHYEPSAIQTPLREFARVLRPGSGLLLGFFHGPSTEPFTHAVIDAYRWSIEALADELNAAQFDVIETHTRTGRDYRPHGAILARLRD